MTNVWNRLGRVLRLIEEDNGGNYLVEKKRGKRWIALDAPLAGKDAAVNAVDAIDAVDANNGDAVAAAAAAGQASAATTTASVIDVEDDDDDDEYDE